MPEPLVHAAALDPALSAAVPSTPADARAFAVDELWSLRLPLPYPTTRAVNAYMLPDADGWTLVDCGSAIGDGWDALERALGLAGIEARAIHTLVLTHLHPDHASLATIVRARLGCRLLRLDAPAAVLDRLRDPTLPLERRRVACHAAGVPVGTVDDMADLPVAGDGREPVPEADALLVCGDVVGDGWEVVELLGHSANQLGLWDPRGRRLLCADVAYPTAAAYLEWGTRPSPWDDQAAALARVEALAPARLLPGHGPPDPEAAVRVAAVREVHVRAFAEVEALLGVGDTTAYAIAAAMADGPNPDRRQSRLSFALCVLEELVAREVAREDIDDDGVRRFQRRSRR